jgi:hypothetical protein
LAPEDNAHRRFMFEVELTFFSNQYGVRLRPAPDRKQNSWGLLPEAVASIRPAVRPRPRPHHRPAMVASNVVKLTTKR